MCLAVDKVEASERAGQLVLDAYQKLRALGSETNVN